MVILFTFRLSKVQDAAQAMRKEGCGAEAPKRSLVDSISVSKAFSNKSYDVAINNLGSVSRKHYLR